LCIDFLFDDWSGWFGWEVDNLLSKLIGLLLHESFGNTKRLAPAVVGGNGLIISHNPQLSEEFISARKIILQWHWL
jgi:hypothetical protein